MASIYFENRTDIFSAATPSDDGFLITYHTDGNLYQKDHKGIIKQIGGSSQNNYQFGNSCYNYDIQFASSSIIPIDGQVIFDEESDILRISDKDADGNDISVYLDTIFDSKQLGLFWSDKNQIIDDSNSGSLYLDQSRFKLESVTCVDFPTPGSSEDPGLTSSAYGGVITGVSFSVVYAPTIESLKNGGESATLKTIYLDPVFIYTEADNLSSNKFITSVFRRDNLSFVSETTDESLMAYANTYFNKSQFLFDDYFYSGQYPRIFNNESLTSDAPAGYYIFESEYNSSSMKKNAVHYLGNGQFENKFPGWNYLSPQPTATQSCTCNTEQLIVNKYGNYYEIPYLSDNLLGSFKPDTLKSTNLCFESMSLNYNFSHDSSGVFDSPDIITTMFYDKLKHAIFYVDDEFSIILNFLNTSKLEYDNNTNTITFTKENGQVDSLVLEVDSKTTADVTANIAVGAIKIGDTISSGTTIQDLVEKLLLTTYNPTFVNPTFGLSDSVNNTQEVGDTINVPLTFNFNRGSIRGDLVNGTWNENSIQNPRAGSSISYTIDGNNQTVNTYTVLNHEVTLGTNTFQGVVEYSIGPQPLDSNGNDFGSRFPAGTSPTRATSFIGYHPYFWGTSNTHISDPIDVITEIEAGNSNKVVSNSGGTLTINAGTSIQFVWLAVPFTFPLKTEWYDTALVNGDVGAPGDIFDENGDRWVAFDNGGSGYSIDSPDGYWSGIKYIIYLQKPSLGGAGLTNPVQFRV